MSCFIILSQEHLQTMTQEVFTNHVEALSSLLLEKAKNLRQQNDRYFGEIISNHYFFDRGNIYCLALDSELCSDLLPLLFLSHLAAQLKSG